MCMWQYVVHVFIVQYVHAHILQFGKDRQHRSHAIKNSNCSSPDQEPVAELNSSTNSQRVEALSSHEGRDLENRQK